MNRSNFPPNRAPRTADQGIGTFVRRMAVGGEATMDPYFESLGYLPGEKELRTSGNNILSALSDFDPVQGIMRGMTAAGVVPDSRYSPEQRKEALIEAGLETIIPVSMIGAGKLAKEPAKKVLMDLFSPTGAPEEVSARPASKAAPVDNTPDNPSRRKFLEGAGAAALAAGVTPDILAEIVPKITQAAARVAPDLLKNPLVMAAAKIKALKKSTDDLYASRGVISESTDSVADLARDRQLRANAYEKIDTFEDVFKSLADPKTGKQTIKEAPDDVLEEILSVQYEGSISLQKLLFRKLPRQGFDPATEIAQEIKRRGLDTAKNKEGILQFPYARQFMEDVLEEGGMSKNAAKWNPEDQIYDPTLFDVKRYAEGGPVGIGTLSNTAKNMFQEAVEPFDPEKHSPIQTAGQSTATEYTSTTESPNGDVWNIPQIWFSVETGEPVLKTGDDAWAAAYEYEKQTGKMFPRFNSIPEAESAAQSRSDQGGASEQPLARMDGGPVYGIGSLNQTARNMFR
jgi:hypothetical protein